MDVLNKLSKEEVITVVEDYLNFYKRVFEVEDQLAEYMVALKQSHVYLSEKGMKLSHFSEFQKDLIILGFMNHLSPVQLDQYIKENLTDSEMEQYYLSI